MDIYYCVQGINWGIVYWVFSVSKLNQAEAESGFKDKFVGFKMNIESLL